MRRVAKEIALKEDTINDITSGNTDTSLFIDRINGYISRANHLINTKLDSLGDVELLESLEEVFDISFDQKDYLRMLSNKYRNHYLGIILLNTNMYDEEDNNKSYVAAVTNKAKALNGRVVDLNTLKKFINSGDVLLIKKNLVKAPSPIKRREKYIDFFVDEIDLDSGTIARSSDLYPYAATVVKKETIAKYVLYDLKGYINEVKHQVREVTDLSKSDDEELANVGKQYRLAYDKNSNNGSLSKGENVVVRYHQKPKRGKRS